MASSQGQPGSAMTTAVVCAGAVSAQFIAGKATRDALYLAHLDVTTLPAMVMAAAGFSILLVGVSSGLLRRVSPATVVPLAFVASAALLLAQWFLLSAAPALVAQALYLQMSGLGPMLGSGVWLIASERFDPRSARRHFARIARIGTLSGLGGALLAERVAVVLGIEAMLPVLAVLNLVCAWQVWRLARVGRAAQAPDPLAQAPDLVAESPRSGMRVLAGTPYLRALAALVLFGTVGATLIDFLFKVQAVEAWGRGDELLQFFAFYYAGVALLAFVVQSTSSAFALEKLGLTATTATPSLAILAGGLGAFVFPGLGGTLALRGGEAVFRGSLFRTGYEIFYTPVPAHEKRAAKSIIDVGFDRLGDALGGGIVRLLILMPASFHHTAILLAAMSCAGAALALSRRLTRGYVQTLERSLLHRALELDLTEVQDATTRTVMLRTLRERRSTGIEPRRPPAPSPARTAPELPFSDPEVQEILALRSRDRDRIRAVLREEQGLPGVLVPYVIPLLAWDPVAEDAVRALRKVAEEHVGTLTDALIHPNQPFAVRRRLARVFSICVSQRAVDGLLLALDDLRFEVRFQCGRSLGAIREKNDRARIDAARIFEVVRREVAVGRPVWESHRLLDRVSDDDRSFVDEFLKDRASQSLAHVFALLALVLPAAPLHIAYRGLHTNDVALRGTALEYLESVLPPDIRRRLWPFLGDAPAATPPADGRAREDVLADLLRSNESILLNLEELRRRAGAGA